MKTQAIEKYMKKHLTTCTMHRFSDGDNRKCSCGLDEARAELMELKAEVEKAYFEGAKEATIRFSYWAEGEQFVGASGMLLSTALRQIDDEYMQCIAAMKESEQK